MAEGAATANRIEFGDCRALLRRWAAEGVRAQTCVTSPPYFGLRDYGHAEQIGLEPTPAAYVQAMVDVFRAVREVLADDGTLWLNLGDSYASSGGHTPQRGAQFADRRRGREHITKSARFTGEGLPAKQLLGIPWRVAFALQEDGWYLRQDIIWHKPNPMPESVRDRCTKAHEYLFLLSKRERYYFDAEAIAEPASGQVPGNKTHKGTTAYADGDVRMRTKSGLVNYAAGQAAADARPQLVRAQALFREKGLTEAHLRAIRAAGVTDTGKTAATQLGTGHSAPDVLRLAAEAKAALGGYYREFLLADTRNKRSVWTVSTKRYQGAHFATFPVDLIEPCVLAGAPAGGVVLDPFMGSATTAEAAARHGRRYLGCELNPAYEDLQRARLAPFRIQQRMFA